MRLFVNTDQQLLTEIAGTSQAVQLLSVPRSANVPLVLQFTNGGIVYEVDPVDITVADEAARFALTVADDEATVGKFVFQTDTGDRWKIIDEDNLDNADGYLEANLTIKWLVKELTKFDGPAMAQLTDFVKSGTGTSAQYKGFVNYITDGINTALNIDSSSTNDVEEVICMAQISWDGIDSGKTGWIRHAIRNDLTRDTDVVPAQLGVKYAKTAIVNGDDFVEVTFGVPYGSANWHFVGAPVVSNLIDATPLGIIVVGLTSRSETGFTIKLSTAVDSSGYRLEWIVALD